MVFAWLSVSFLSLAFYSLHILFYFIFRPLSTSKFICTNVFSHFSIWSFANWCIVGVTVWYSWVYQLWVFSFRLFLFLCYIFCFVLFTASAFRSKISVFVGVHEWNRQKKTNENSKITCLVLYCVNEASTEDIKDCKA